MDTLESYISTFENLRYQLMMHNNGLGELFFVTQLIKGLKSELGSVVQSKVPASIERVVLLAKIQQQVLDKGKSRWQKQSNGSRQSFQQSKPETKGNSTPSTFWNERQVRDY